MLCSSTRLSRILFRSGLLNQRALYGRLPLFLLLLLASWGARAQVQLQKESFETDGEGTRYVSNYTILPNTVPAGAPTRNQYFFRASEANMCNGTTTPCTGNLADHRGTHTAGGTLDGTYYWAGEGVRGATPVAPAAPDRQPGTVTLNSINTTGYRNLQVKVGLQDGRYTATSLNWETNDTLKVQVRFNGTSPWVTVGQFTSDASVLVQTGPDVYAGQLRQDVNLDGKATTADPLVTATMQDFTFELPSTATTLQTRFVASQAGLSEEFSFDNIRVLGTPTANAAPVLANSESTIKNYPTANAAVQITNTITLADADNATQTSAIVRITTGWDPANDVLAFTGTAATGNITGTYNASTGVLTLISAGSTATLAQWQAALRLVTFQTNTALPSGSQERAILFATTDPSGTQSNAAFRSVGYSPAVAPTVSTAAPGSVATTSAVLGGNVTADGGDNVTERGVVYSTSNNTPTTADAKATNGTGTGTFSATISTLTPGTTYYVRAYAINSAGTSYGSSISFTTTPNAPVVDSPANGSLLSTDTPTYTGTAPAGSTVTVYVDGSSISTTAPGGNWSLAQPASLTQGSHTVRATAQVTGSAVSANSNTNTFSVDTVRPTVAISSATAPNGGTSSNTPFAYTVTFSENVNASFVAGDVTVTNGTISGFTTVVPGTTFTFNVTPTANGVVSVTVPANVAQDAAGNFNTAGTPAPYSITYNTPSTTVASVTRLTPSPTATGQVSYRVIFAASVTGISTTNFSVTTAGTVSGASVSSASGSGTTYTVTVNTGTGDGTLRLNVQNSTGITPSVTNVPYTIGEVYTITKSFAAAPQLTIVGTGGSGSDVTAFVDVAQVLSGGSPFTNALQNGSFEIHNALSNGDFGYNPTGASWTFNAQSGIAESGSAFTPTTPIPNGIAVAFVQSNGGGNGQLQQNLAVPTGSNYQVSFQAAQRVCCTTLDQSLNVFLNGVYLGTIQPNSSLYSTFTSATFAVTAPALTATVSTTSGSPTSTSPIPFSVSFSQSTGTTFVASDVTVTGGTITGGSFAGSGAGSYTFTVTPSGTGTVSVSLAANVANDANNTQNTASNAVSVQYVQPVTAAPVVTVPANGSALNTNTPTYSGTAVANSTVTVYVDGSSIGTTTATAGGSFSLVQPSALAQGSHTVYATAQTSGSAMSANSTTNNFTVDSVQPTVAITSSVGASGSTTNTSPIPFTITFSESVTGFVTGDVTVTNGTISGFVGSGATYTFNVTPSANGVVTVNVPTNVAQDAAGNPNTAASSPYTITYSATPTIAGFAADPASVCVDSPLTFTATVGNLTGSDTYTLTNGSSVRTGTLASSAFRETLTSSGTGGQSFTLTVSSSGQRAMATTPVTVNALPLATLTNDGPLSCTMTSVTLTASGGGTYQFSPGATQLNGGNTASVNTAGTYSVTVTSANGCSATASTTVVGDQTAPTPGLTNNGPLSCTMTSVTLTASGGNTYRFSSGATQIGTSNQATVGVSGTYSVTVTGANGCSATAQTTVTGDQSAPTATLTNNGPITCSMSSVTLTASGGTSYRFSSGASQIGSSNQATVTIGGLYSVTVTNAGNGCSGVTSTSVSSSTVLPTATISGNTTVTSGGSTTLTVSGGTSQTWSTGQTTTSITVMAGAYSVTVTNASGCSSSTSVTVSTVNSAPMATANTNQTATVGVPFSYTVNAFTDSETPNQLTYTASINPANGFSFDPNTRIISGTPSMSGVSSVTVTATDPGSLSANTSFTITVSPVPPTPVFSITGVTTVGCQVLSPGQRRVTFNPRYEGLDGSPVSFSVVNELAPTTSPGPYTLNLYTDNPVITLRALQSGAATSFAYNWLSACSSSTANTPPTVANPVSPQSATVNIGYTLSLAGVFTDTETPNGLTLSVSGLPAGLNFVAPSTISGTPSMSGVSTVTVTATDPGSMSASTSFTLTVNPAAGTPPPPTGTFSITSVQTISCEVLSAGQRRLTFNPQYAGLNGAPVSFSVVNELAPTTAPGPYTLNLYTDNSVVTLRAVQSGIASSFAYNWLIVCSSTTANTAPTVANPVPPQSATVGVGYTLSLANVFTDAETPNGLTLSVNGLPAGLNFVAPSTISGTPSMSGVSTVTVTATDPGSMSASTSFSITVNPAGGTPPPPTGTFSITSVQTISCEVLSAGQRRLTFNPRYAGLNGAPVSFSVVNELVPTTNPGPYTLDLYSDNPVIGLRAVQSGVSASFSYGWLAACNPGARLGTGSEVPLTVTVLGNPVLGKTVSVEVRGAEGQSLRLQLTDERGHFLSEQSIGRAEEVERQTLSLGQVPAGVLLLRVSTSTQSQTVKLLKTE